MIAVRGPEGQRGRRFPRSGRAASRSRPTGPGPRAVVRSLASRRRAVRYSGSSTSSTKLVYLLLKCGRIGALVQTGALEGARHGGACSPLPDGEASMGRRSVLTHLHRAESGHSGCGSSEGKKWPDLGFQPSIWSSTASPVRGRPQDSARPCTERSRSAGAFPVPNELGPRISELRLHQYSALRTLHPHARNRRASQPSAGGGCVGPPAVAPGAIGRRQVSCGLTTPRVERPTPSTSRSRGRTGAPPPRSPGTARPGSPRPAGYRQPPALRAGRPGRWSCRRRGRSRLP